MASFPELIRRGERGQRGDAAQRLRGERRTAPDKNSPRSCPREAQQFVYGPCDEWYHRRPGSLPLSKIVTIGRVEHAEATLSVKHMSVRLCLMACGSGTDWPT